MEAKFTSDMSKLDKFVKGINQSDKYIVKLGILGDKSARDDTSSTDNAAVGAAMELGVLSEHIPARSFLRMPLFQKIDLILQTAGQGAEALLAAGNIKQVLHNLGAACEMVVAMAFESGGFGTWRKLKPATIMRKIQHNPKPLINTTQLEDSITHVVEEI